MLEDGGLMNDVVLVDMGFGDLGFALVSLLTRA